MLSSAKRVFAATVLAPLALAFAGNLAYSYETGASPLSSVFGSYTPHFANWDTGASYPYRVSISPNGKRIAVITAAPHSFAFALYVGGRGKLHRVASDSTLPDNGPRWVDDNTLLFERATPLSRKSTPLCEVSVSSKQQTCFTPANGYASSYEPSPDGRYLAYASHAKYDRSGRPIDRLYVHDWKTGRDQLYAAASPLDGFLAAALTWSHDGKSLFFVRRHGRQQEQVEMISATTPSASPRLLATMPSLHWIVSIAPPYAGHVKVAVLRPREEPRERTTDIVSIPLTGGRAETVASVRGFAMHASWSADAHTVLLSGIVGVAGASRLPESALISDRSVTVFPDRRDGAISASGREQAWIDSFGGIPGAPNAALRYQLSDGSVYTYVLPQEHFFVWPPFLRDPLAHGIRPLAPKSDLGQ